MIAFKLKNLSWTMALVTLVAAQIANAEWKQKTVEINPAFKGLGQQELTIGVDTKDSTRVQLSNGEKTMTIRSIFSLDQNEFGVSHYSRYLLRTMDADLITDRKTHEQVKDFQYSEALDNIKVKGQEQLHPINLMLFTLPSILVNQNFAEKHYSNEMRDLLIGMMLSPIESTTVCSSGKTKFKYDLKTLTSSQGCNLEISRTIADGDPKYYSPITANLEIDNCVEALDRNVRSRITDGYSCEITSKNY